MDKKELLDKYAQGERDFSDADLGGAYLRGADLGGAYLRGADLGDADLRGADLGDADLGGAYLRGADLGGAYLRGADLRGADLGGAYLGGAYLEHNKTIIFCNLGNYTMHLHQGKEGIMVVAGCRYFTIDEAKEHWRPENIGSWTQKEVSYGERQIRMINFLEAEAIAKGWFADEIHEIKEKSVSEK